MNVVSFYRFINVADPAALKKALLRECQKGDLLGTILVAPEGINGTLAGDASEIRSVFAWLEDRLGLDEPLDGHWTEAGEAPFRRMRVRVKKEIVALGRPDIRPDRGTGQYVGVQEWNRLIADPDTLVIDTRNHYEYEVGTFLNAVDPGTDSFREFSDYASQLAEEDRDRPLAMFCTGGIRCEKATALMLELGFRQVYHLEGGILKYLEEVGDADNLWQGECFVFDTRVAVDRDRAEGGYVQCHACRRPLSAEDLASPDYREGVSCPKCVGTHDAERVAKLEERRKQVRLARERGDEHIGAHLD
jgi:UPF0176 protein